MTRSLLLAGAAGLLLLSGAPGAVAQTDSAAQQMIERLRPQPGGHLVDRTRCASNRGRRPNRQHAGVSLWQAGVARRHRDVSWRHAGAVARVEELVRDLQRLESMAPLAAAR